MAKLRYVCHRCRHKFKAKIGAADCTKCGSDMTGPTDQRGSLLVKLGVLIVGAAAVGYFVFGIDSPEKLQDSLEEVQERVEEATQEDEPTPTPTTSER